MCGYIDAVVIYGVWAHRWCYDIGWVCVCVCVYIDGVVIYGVWVHRWCYDIGGVGT